MNQAHHYDLRLAVLSLYTLKLKKKTNHGFYFGYKKVPKNIKQVITYMNYYIKISP